MKHHRSRTEPIWVTALLLGVAFPVGLRGQEQAALRGVVADALTDRPLGGVKLSIIGTDLTARTDKRGNYRLTRVPTGSVHVRLEHSRYAGSVTEITVSPSGLTIADFTLSPLSSVLDEIVVRGEPSGERGRKQGASVGLVSGADAAASTSGNALDLIDAGVAGVQINRGSSGQVGAGVRLQLRGLKSFLLSNDPLVYVDGIRVSETRGPSPNRITGPGVLDLIDPESIDRIEVLRGPAASALYGDGASNGVILIHTKKGGERTPD